MHRFNIPHSPISNEVLLNKEESRHALTVLRVKAGEAVELLDGKGGVFRGIIAETGKSGVKVSVMGESPRAQSRVPLTLAAAVIKPDAMELLIQKACELGASAIVPLITERTVVRLSAERWQSKLGRWQKIARESCKQCGQTRTPEIRPAEDFKKFTASIPGYDLALIPTLTGQVQPLGAVLNAHKNARSALVLIGPEGDFTEKEVLEAAKAGAKPVDLGPWVLRSETAALYALSVLGFFYGNASREGKNANI